MATINLGAIKFNWKGAYNSSTTYAVDDVVSSGGNSYVCIQAHSNQAVGNATAYWNIMSEKGTNGTDGTDGTDLTTTLTTQGDILYRDGSGLVRLPAGTSGQALLTGGAGANPSWGAVSAGVTKYACHRPTSNGTGAGVIDAGVIVTNTFSGSELNSNGTFTASEAGNYYFASAHMHANNGGGAFGVILQKNGSTINGGQTYMENYDDMAQTAVIVPLAVGDTLRAYAQDAVYANYGCRVIMKLN